MANMERTLTQELKELFENGWEIEKTKTYGYYHPSHFSFGEIWPLSALILKKGDERKELLYEETDATLLSKGRGYYKRYHQFMYYRKLNFWWIFQDIGVDLSSYEEETMKFLQYHNWYCGGVPISVLSAWVFYMAQAWVEFKKESPDLSHLSSESVWSDYRGKYKINHEMFECGKERMWAAYAVIRDNLSGKIIAGDEEDKEFFFERYREAFEWLLEIEGDKPFSADYMEALTFIVEKVAAALEGSDKFRF